MSRRDKAIINQLLYRIADLEDAIDERDAIIACGRRERLSMTCRT